MRDEAGVKRAFVRWAYISGTTVTLTLVVSLILLDVAWNSTRTSSIQRSVSLPTIGPEPGPEFIGILSAVGVLSAMFSLMVRLVEACPGSSEIGMVVGALIAYDPGPSPPSPASTK